MDLTQMVAQRMAKPAMSRPRPDKPPASFKPGGPIHPIGYETRKVNGKWVLVPTKFGRGKGDPALAPKVSYTPFP